MWIKFVWLELCCSTWSLENTDTRFKILLENPDWCSEPSRNSLLHSLCFCFKRSLAVDEPQKWSAGNEKYKILFEKKLFREAISQLRMYLHVFKRNYFNDLKRSPKLWCEVLRLIDSRQKFNIEIRELGYSLSSSFMCRMSVCLRGNFIDSEAFLCLHSPWS